MSRRRTQPALTTTSFALLSHLALRPWSAYELAVERVRYFRYFWARAERGIYQELKRLDALGMVTAKKEYRGRRARTVYSITPAGVAALRDWLESPLAPISLEFEALLRVFAAPLGTVDQLKATLEKVRGAVAEMTAFNDAIVQEYLDGSAPFQHEAYVRTLVVDFLTDWMATIERWVDRTVAEVETWKDLSPEGKQERVRARLVAARSRRD